MVWNVSRGLRDLEDFRVNWEKLDHLWVEAEKKDHCRSFFYWDSEEDTRGYKYLSWLQTDNIKEEETTVTAISLFTRNSHSR